MSDSEGNKSFDDPSIDKRSKKSKSSKKDKKKGEGKSWRMTDSEKQQISDADGKQNGGLKINVVPTDIDDQAQAGSPLKVNIPESPLSRKGASPDQSQSPNNRGESKLTNHSRNDEGASPTNKLGSALGMNSGDDGKPSRIVDKREMDKILLNRETKVLKEQLLDAVDELIVRQNKMTPVANFENFVTETSARKVLKELLAEFNVTAEVLTTKLSTQQDQTKQNKQRGENLEVIVKGMKDSIKGVKGFEERLKRMEGKIESVNEKVENTSRTQKEHLTSTKDMLLQRFDVIAALEDQIRSIKDDIKQTKDLNDNFQNRVSNQLVDQEKNITLFSSKLDDSTKDTHEKLQNSKAQVNAQVSEIRDIHKRIEMFNQNITAQFEKQNIDISLRVQQNDMKQNFQKLNDLLAVKFKQVEDCKQACRQMIVYQKYYYPIETQQLISENLLNLKAAAKDKEFAIFQRRLYQDSALKLKDTVQQAEWIEDVDLRDHLNLLQEKNIRTDAGDWVVAPSHDITAGFDFVTDIMENYLTELRVRKKEEMFGEKCDSFFLRRAIRLGEIDLMVDETQSRILKLIANAQKIEKEILAEERKREIARNIKTLNHLKLSYKLDDTKKRRRSFKGRIQPALFKQGVEQEEASVAVERGKPARPKSKEFKRGTQNRTVKQEHMINWEEGYKPGASQTSFMAKSVLESETFEGTQSQQNFHKEGGGGGGRKGTGGGAEGGPAAGAGVAGGGGNVTQVQKVDMTKEQKRQFIAEIKVELREMINSIAVHHVTESSTKTTKRADVLEATNQKEHADMFAKFEKEMLVVAEYCKKQVLKVQNDFQDDIRSMQKLRARDRSDYDQILNKQDARITENRSDVDVHATYFDVFAQSIALLTENLNMQMESEYADIYDRNLMSLYGNQQEQPTLMDHTTRKKNITKYLKNTERGTSEDDNGDYFQVNVADGNKINDVNLGKSAGDQQETVTSNKTIQRPSENYEEGQKPNDELTRKVVRQDPYHDPIRDTSGKQPLRKILPLTLDQQCLNHSSSNHDKHLTLKLFKTACLAYKPSKVNYREMNLERKGMVKMRRNLIDQLTQLLPTCHIFKEKAFYPKKYFDDLMLQESENHEVLEQMATMQSIEKLSSVQLQQTPFTQATPFKKGGPGSNVILGRAGSSTNFGSDDTKQQLRGLGHSPTERTPLNTNKLILPDVHNFKQLASKMAFGLGDKNNYDAISDIQQQPTPAGPDGRGLLAESDMGYYKKSRKRGIHAQVFTGQFRPTDIERNSMLSYGYGGSSNRGHEAKDELASMLGKSPSSNKQTFGIFHRRNNSTLVKSGLSNTQRKSTSKKLNIGIELMEEQFNGGPSFNKQRPSADLRGMASHKVLTGRGKMVSFTNNEKV